MLGEGFEASIVVAIVFAYLNKIGRRDVFNPVWLGVLAAQCSRPSSASRCTHSR
jgi:high-affinity Fe2+/Pb2+ permease